MRKIINVALSLMLLAAVAGLVLSSAGLVTPPPAEADGPPCQCRACDWSFLCQQGCCKIESCGPPCIVTNVDCPDPNGCQ